MLDAPGAIGIVNGWHRQETRMNRIDRFFGLRGEAKVKFLNGEFQVLSPGDFVRCAVSGEPIMLPDLRYWSVELQEAYATPELSMQRYLQMRDSQQREQL
jgi:hypothetical protein